MLKFCPDTCLRPVANILKKEEEGEGGGGRRGEGGWEGEKKKKKTHSEWYLDSHFSKTNF